MLKTTHKTDGFGMIEVIISSAIASMLLMTFLGMMLYSVRITKTTTEKLRANLYLREAVEITKDLEQSDWSRFSPLCLSPLKCHPVISGNTWTLVSDEEFLDGGDYTRSISVETVYRDTLTFPNSIVPAGTGVLDPNTKKIVATVTWNTDSVPRTESIETYVYNY